MDLSPSRVKTAAFIAAGIAGLAAMPKALKGIRGLLGIRIDEGGQASAEPPPTASFWTLTILAAQFDGTPIPGATILIEDNLTFVPIYTWKTGADGRALGSIQGREYALEGTALVTGAFGQLNPLRAVRRPLILSRDTFLVLTFFLV